MRHRRRTKRAEIRYRTTERAVIAKNPNDVALLQKRKQLFIDRGNLEAAMMDQEIIVSLDSLNHELLFELAEMQYNIAINGKPNYYKVCS